MKKFFLVVLFLFCTVLNYGQTNSTIPNGSGSEIDPYQIESLANLSWLIQNPNEWGAYYIQTANIDASETATWDDADDNSDGDLYNDANDLTEDGNNEGFLPIGNEGVKFTGYYRGNHKTIDGMNINRPSTSYLGFFGYVENSAAANVGIKDLGLTNVTIAANGFSGGFVGQNYENTFSNCYVKGSIAGNGPDGYLGGFVGYNHEGSVIEKCYAKVDVLSNGIAEGDAYVGGFVGRNRKYNVNPLIKECYSSGNVTVSGAIRRVGGFAGQQAYGRISNCYSTGTVNYQGFRSDPQAGGFCGRSYSDTLEYCYSTGKFIADSLNDKHTRGFIGSNNSDNTYAGNFLDTLVSGCNGDKVGSAVTGKTTTEMMIQSTFTEWDFENIWYASGTSYPQLRALYVATDNDAPTPNPMTFSVVPNAVDHQSISMTATIANDTSGAQYFFECTSGGGNSSGWQDSDKYIDTGLRGETEYSYRVKARDKSFNNNETDYSAVASATTEVAPPLLYIEKDGLCAMEAEHAVVSQNNDLKSDGTTMKWHEDSVEDNFAATGYMTTQDDVASNATWDNGTELAWEVEIATEGEYFIAVRRIAKDGGDDSGFYGVDGNPKYDGTTDLLGVADAFTWVHGINSLGTLIKGKHTIQIRRRETGFIVDRVIIANSLDKLPIDGSQEIGPPESLPGIIISAPSFAVEPYAISETKISMTASDTTGRIAKFLFECVNDPSHTSGWIASETYLDSNLVPGTEYTYRVKGIDANKYETDFSGEATAKTEGEEPSLFNESNGICVMEAENGVVTQNNDSTGFTPPFDEPLKWFADSSFSGYEGTGYMTTENEIALNATWENGTQLSWMVDIKTEGEYFVAIRRNNNGDNASETAKPGIDGIQKAYSAFWGSVEEFTWVHGPSLGNVEEGKHTIQIRRREDGLMIDRVMIADSYDKFPADGSTEVGPLESVITAVDFDSELNSKLPSEYSLQQNYPNPFNPSTIIAFSIPKAANTELSVYNILGEKVATLVNEMLSAGTYKYEFNGNALSSGLYLYRLQSNNFSEIKKMMLIK